MQLIDLVNDGKELVNTEDSGNVSTLQASMLSGLTDKAIVHSQKKVYMSRIVLNLSAIRPCHKAAILPRETKKALFYHAKPHPHGFHCKA